MPLRTPPQGPQIPLIGQQQKQAEHAIGQAIEQLSLSLYAQVASSRLATAGGDQDQETLHKLARDAHRAAQAYFEGRGMASFQQPAQQ